MLYILLILINFINFSRASHYPAINQYDPANIQTLTYTDEEKKKYAGEDAPHNDIITRYYISQIEQYLHSASYIRPNFTKGLIIKDFYDNIKENLNDRWERLAMAINNYNNNYPIEKDKKEIQNIADAATLFTNPHFVIPDTAIFSYDPVKDNNYKAFKAKMLKASYFIFPIPDRFLTIITTAAQNLPLADQMKIKSDLDMIIKKNNLTISSALATVIDNLGTNQTSIPDIDKVPKGTTKGLEDLLKGLYPKPSSTPTTPSDTPAPLPDQDEDILDVFNLLKMLEGTLHLLLNKF